MRFEQPTLKRFGWTFPLALVVCWAALTVYKAFERAAEQQFYTSPHWGGLLLFNAVFGVPVALLSRWGLPFLLVATALALAAASVRRGEEDEAPVIGASAHAAPAPSVPAATGGTPVSKTGAKGPRSKWLSRTVGGLLIFLMFPAGGWLLLMIVLSPFVWDGCPDTGCRMMGVWVADAMFGAGWLLAFCVAWIGYTQTDRDRVPAWAYPLLGWALLIVFVLVGLQIAESAQHANARH